MADTEEPRFNSLADRIAALNKQPNFSSPSPATTAGTPAGKRRPPPPPPSVGRLHPESRSQTQPAPAVAHPQISPSVPPRPSRTSTGGAANRLDPPPSLPNRSNGAPPLPTRKASHASQLSESSRPSPALPPRRPSGNHQLAVRRNSNSSDVSHLSNFSALSVSATSLSSNDGGPRKLPPPLEQAKLPPLPPTRRELEAKAKEEAEAAARKNQLVSSQSTAAIPKVRNLDPAPAARPALPPRLPSRPSKSPQPQAVENGTPSPGARRLPPPPSAWKRPSPNGDQPPPLPTSRPRPVDRTTIGDVPPPVPLSSRPSASQIDAAAAVAPPVRPPTTTPVPNSSTAHPSQQPQGNCCLVCRDFSGPDTVAAQYPRENLPRDDPAGYLAHVLCAPFPSATDKARAIFTWCHHNIAYDTYSFFNKCVRHQSTEDLIFSGKAVCMGYSKVYHDIAARAGLECVEISGHGKGFGFSKLTPGQPTPAEDHNHAWNAVRIDGGEWKLLDSCWGAGHICDANNLFKKQFNPSMFTMSNERFGNRHFPSNKSSFFRADGSRPTWDEYVWGPKEQVGVEKCNWYTTATEEGLDEFNFEPYAKFLSVYHSPEPVVRFQFAKLCPHWTTEKQGKGKPYLFVLEVGGVDGRKKECRVVEHNEAWYWIDVPRRELGAPGQKVKLMALKQLNGRDGRGITQWEWENKGPGSWSFQSLADWELVR